MLEEWAPINKEDALYLLSANFCCNQFFTSIESGVIQEIRKYAIKRLETVSDEDIHLILLQLVQALKYEELSETPLLMFLISRAVGSPEIAISLYWFLKVEVEN